MKLSLSALLNEVSSSMLSPVDVQLEMLIHEKQYAAEISACPKMESSASGSATVGRALGKVSNGWHVLQDLHRTVSIVVFMQRHAMSVHGIHDPLDRHPRAFKQPNLATTDACGTYQQQALFENSGKWMGRTMPLHTPAKPRVGVETRNPQIRLAGTS